jgi:hypothetical protein
MPKRECPGGSGPKWDAGKIGFLTPCEIHCCTRSAIVVQNVALSITAEQKKSPAPMGHSDSRAAHHGHSTGALRVLYGYCAGTLRVLCRYSPGTLRVLSGYSAGTHSTKIARVQSSIHAEFCSCTTSAAAADAFSGTSMMYLR